MTAEEARDAQWFALHTYSGHENKVKLQIEHLATIEGLRPYLKRVVVPAVPEVQIRNGKKRQVMKNFMPGYLLIQMEPEKELFGLATKISGVTGFVPNSHTPQPMPEHEVATLLAKIEGTEQKPKTEIKYEVGDAIKVTQGAFAGFQGNVSEVDRDKGKLKVMISILGRSTAVEIDVAQVEAA
jgi:transcriptional antiterminator NusG